MTGAPHFHSGRKSIFTWHKRERKNESTRENKKLKNRHLNMPDELKVSRLIAIT
jgi:hypothetical protein